MFVKLFKGIKIKPQGVVNCEGGGACNVGSASDCKNATGNSSNEGSHNLVTQKAMSSNPGK